MIRNCLHWARAHPLLTAALLLLFLFAALNTVAYRHAHAMTHFTETGLRTARPEALSRFQKARILLTGVRIPRPRNEREPDQVGLLFEVHHFRGMDGTALEAWYVPHAGPRGLVLMFHGYAGCKADLLPEARAFHDAGYAAFLVDFRGSGGSGSNETTVGVKEAGDVARAVDYVRGLGLDGPLVLYGHSMGSAAILRALQVHGLSPAVLILECPFDRLLSTVGNRFHAMGLPAFPFAHLLVFWGGAQHDFNGFRHNPAEYARAVRCPVLLLLGEDDPRVTPEQARSVFDALGGEKEMHSFTGVRHDAYLAARPEEWKETVFRFLDGKVNQPAPSLP